MWIRFLACAAESADSTSDCTLDFERWGDLLERSATWRGKRSPSRVWAKRFKKGGWTKRLSGAVISETFPQEPWLESIGFAGDIHANRLAKQESEQGSTTPDTCGLPSSSLFGGIDLPACCSKTSRATSRWGCSTSCPIWKAAVTERRGAAIRRRLSAHHTDASESSSSAWRTPTAQPSGVSVSRLEGKLGSRLYDKKTGRNAQYGLEQQVNWPTPDCTMRPHEGNVRLLRKAVENGLPKWEADAMLGRDISKPQGKLGLWNECEASASVSPATSDGVKPTKAVSRSVNATWATPTTADADKATMRSTQGRCLAREVVIGLGGRIGPEGSSSMSHRGRLNPDWVEMLMGFPVGWTDCAPSETQ